MAINVLIVDDSHVMQAMVKKILNLSGLDIGNVHLAADGEAGLAILDEHWVDMIITDLNMPKMNGEKLINAIRENHDFKKTPILVISTEGSETRIRRIQERGASFIRKPFTPEIVRDAIVELLGEGVINGATTQ